MIITLISDTHGSHWDLTIPECNILLHAGDFTSDGTVKSAKDFLDWTTILPVEKVIVCPGNHDQCCLNREINSKKCTVLKDSSTIIEGIKIYCMPWTLSYGDWSFMADENKLNELCNRIPDDTDILVTHGAPYSILDMTNHGHTGSKNLLHRILDLNIKHTVFGHIHEEYGYKKIDEMNFYNCSIVDDRYEIVNRPMRIKL